MPDPVNLVEPDARTRPGLRWAMAIGAALGVVGTLYFALFSGRREAVFQANDSPGAYVDRWIAVDVINRSSDGPLDITELTITGGQGLLVVEVRGQKVDKVHNGNWTQSPCPSGCLLGIAYATPEGDSLISSVETAPGLIHKLALKVKAPSPGSDALLTVVETVMLGDKALASSTHEFVSNGLIHPERMMDTGLPKLR